VGVGVVSVRDEKRVDVIARLVWVAPRLLKVRIRADGGRSGDGGDRRVEHLGRDEE
jgi:hypothetical protein